MERKLPTPTDSNPYPLTKEQIERVRSVYKRHFSDGDRIDSVCDMALASITPPERAVSSATPASRYPSNEELDRLSGAVRKRDALAKLAEHIERQFEESYEMGEPASCCFENREDADALLAFLKGIR